MTCAGLSTNASRYAFFAALRALTTASFICSRKLPVNGPHLVLGNCTKLQHKHYWLAHFVVASFFSACLPKLNKQSPAEHLCCNFGCLTERKHYSAQAIRKLIIQNYQPFLPCTCARTPTLIACSRAPRFLAICFPMDWHMSSRAARWTILGIWLFSLSISMPWAIYFKLVPYASQEDNKPFVVCEELWPDENLGMMYFVFANLILCYLLPLVVITACYVGIWYKIWRRNIPGEHRVKGCQIDLLMQKSKLKVVKMMFVVVIIFIISWAPLYAIFVRIRLGPPLSPWEDTLIEAVMPFAQW